MMEASCLVGDHTYLAGVEWWGIKMEGDGPVAVAGVLDPVQAQLIAHVSHLILKNVLLLLNFAGAILVLGFVGPVIPRLNLKQVKQRLQRPASSYYGKR